MLRVRVLEMADYGREGGVVKEVYAKPTDFALETRLGRDFLRVLAEPREP